MAIVNVDLTDRRYEIAIGSGASANVASYLTAWAPTSHVVLVTDETVDELIADNLADRLNAEEIEVHILTVPPGEASKSIETAADLWETMREEGADRGSVVMAVGGGVVGDLAGFVAATYARGLRFVQVPTTLLAQVDSSVGGKVGINLSQAKNMVGAFWQPHGVLIDVDLLRTLPPREFAAGMAEVVKYGMIMDVDFIEWLETNQQAIRELDTKALEAVVERCCRLKAQVVEADEREISGHRAILNYGHTFAHALEAATGYGPLLHGEAVAIGMACAAELAHKLGRVDRAFCQRQNGLLAAFGLPLAVPSGIDHEELLRLMWHDKKVSDNQLVFVLPSRIGQVELVADVDSALVLASLQQAAN